jgi:hypothetical protein
VVTQKHVSCKARKTGGSFSNMDRALTCKNGTATDEISKERANEINGSW